MIKRFHISSITRDREYDLTKGTKGSKILYFGISKTPEEQDIVYVKHAEGQNLRTRSSESISYKYQSKVEEQMATFDKIQSCEGR